MGWSLSESKVRSMTCREACLTAAVSPVNEIVVAMCAHRSPKRAHQTRAKRRSGKVGVWGSQWHALHAIRDPRSGDHPLAPHLSLITPRSTIYIYTLWSNVLGAETYVMVLGTVRI